MLKPTMTVGELAQAGEVHVETVRYYQSLHLLPTPKRPIGGIRRYNQEALQRLFFITRAKRLGFSLDEVRALIDLSSGKHCKETRTLAVKKLATIEEKLDDLRAMRKVLRGLAARCARGGGAYGCPMIDALNK
jgi:MerR family mercuric resistance operon transcriptional regulator